jgi:hypothetical protein
MAVILLSLLFLVSTLLPLLKVRAPASYALKQYAHVRNDGVEALTSRQKRVVVNVDEPDQLLCLQREASMNSAARLPWEKQRALHEEARGLAD